jgi:hypothetical protein
MPLIFVVKEYALTSSSAQAGLDWPNAIPASWSGPDMLSAPLRPMSIRLADLLRRLAVNRNLLGGACLAGPVSQADGVGRGSGVPSRAPGSNPVLLSKSPRPGFAYSEPKSAFPPVFVVVQHLLFVTHPLCAVGTAAARLLLAF